MDFFNKLLDYIRKENRAWVIILFFLAFAIYVLRESLNFVVKKNYDPVIEQTTKAEKVNEKLQYLLEATNADRVYIFQFHNGVTYYTGEHAQRFTCTYEIARKGISSEAPNLQGLQVTVFSWFISQTIKGEMCYIDVENIPHYTTRYTLHAQGIQSLKVMPLIYNGQVVGMIGVDYVLRQNEFVKEPIYNDWFELVANEVSELLHK